MKAFEQIEKEVEARGVNKKGELVAKNLLLNGKLSDEEIIETTGVTPEQLQAIKLQMKK